MKRDRSFHPGHRPMARFITNAAPRGMRPAVVIGLLLACTAARGVDVWTESSLVNVMPDHEPGARASEAARIYAARGEWESFQICLNGGRKGLRVVSARGDAPRPGFPPPLIRRVGYLLIEAPSPRSSGESRLWPDPLLEMAPFDIPPGETRALWVTYFVPRDAPKGVQQALVEIAFEKGPKKRVPVSIEVFEFTLPEMPSLRTLFQLDRTPIRGVFGIDSDDLTAWKPIYDAVAPYRISYGLWNDGSLVAVDAEGHAETETFKEHLAYTVEASHMNTVNVGKGDRALSPFPEPSEGVLQDTLQLFLHDMGNWLQEREWLDRAILQPLPQQDSGAWQDARKAYFRASRADKRLHRVLVGSLHPSLERYTDVWAVPARFYQPYAQRRLQEGHSLQAEPAYPVRVVSASSSDSGGRFSLAPCVPDEAYDGSLFTAWVSGNVPAARKAEWLQIDLEELIHADRVRIAWKPGLEPRDLKVYTTFDGRLYGTASTKWEHHRPIDQFDESWSVGRFRSEKGLRGIRFEFREPSNDGPIGIVEVEFDQAPADMPTDRIEPLEIWTYSLEGDFPSLLVDAESIEARLCAWVTWGHRARGFLGGSLSNWPDAWSALAGEQPLVWSGAGQGASFLFYPGKTTLLSSMRAERFRDGVDDFDYLTILKGAIDDKRIDGALFRPYLAQRYYDADVRPSSIAKLGKELMEGRVDIGRALKAALAVKP